MYENYYGLTCKPFDLSPDPKVVYKSEAHQEALAILQYGVVDRKGFLLLTGEVGTGKTTLLNHLVKSIDKTVHYCLISNPLLSSDDFYLFISEQLSLQNYDGNKARFLLKFAEFIDKCAKNDERVLLIIDEAHVIPTSLLEEIRMLSNQGHEQFGILSIFLVGQPELNEKMADERFLPLRQRIAIRFHLGQFSEEDTEKYILFRINRAGGQRSDLFTPAALRLIYLESRGTPRLVNVVCDQALLLGFADGCPVIDEEIVRKCVNDIHIPGESTALALPVTIKDSNFLFFVRRFAQTVILSIILLVLLTVLVQIYHLAAPQHWPAHQQIDWLHEQAGKLNEDYFGKGI